ncbi:MAG TPA: hypothetical protein VHB77_17220 [Planctomycetaceae bacterium]|nr:hypothetical protein [Planctomycetaceae bacterium]
MRILCPLLLANLLLFANGVRAAEEEPAPLPPAGTWARYHVVIKGTDAAEQTGELTVKFLGSEQVEGKNCRWIEFRWKFQDWAQVEQYLATEQALRESKLPLHESLKGRVRDDEGPTRDLLPPNCTGPSFVLFWLPGARKAAEQVDETVTVEYQRGRLTSKLGYRTVQRSGPEIDGAPLPAKREYTVWVHPEVPMHLRLRIRGTEGAGPGGTWSHEQTLQDFGQEEESKN